MAKETVKEVRIPDIGDFSDVPVIEILVKPGDTVQPEDPLIVLESDKATMDIPAPEAGTVAEVKVAVGDKVSKGSVILTLNASGEAAEAKPAKEAGTPEKASTAASPEATTPAPAAATSEYAGKADVTCQMVVLGSGPGGYSAAFRAADLGMETVLIERWPVLGGVCLNVGCIPSKALLHTTAVMEEAQALSAHGIKFAAPKIDLQVLREHKDKVVSKLTTGLGGMAKARKVTVVTGSGRFLDPYHIEVALSDGSGTKIVKFEKAIIAAGSEAVKLPFLPEDPRIVDSTGALELRKIPKKMLVIGGGIIGLEMATVYSALGARLECVEMLDGLMLGADRDLVKVWEKKNAHRFDAIMLETKTVSAAAKKDGIHVTFEGKNAPKDPQVYDMVLVAVGRSPNGKRIDADKAGVSVDERGFIAANKQMQTNVAHIYAIGDIAGGPMLAHKAVHEGHVAAESAAGKPSYFDARQIPAVAYTDPEIAWAGLTEAEAKQKGIKFTKAVFPWAASGRAIANGRDEGFTKLMFDVDDHRIIGGGIVGTHAGDLISEVALAVEMGADAVDIAKTIHPHPTLSESIGMAAEVFEGTCTDLPPARKR
ncbi:Dihydrolipoamide dehydrogenase (E3) component ofpyruvate dehydrogenase [Candidatus Filomicrobium marinum]|uniref:Dihydrolipoyl dehydrogenase n=1 Tax=Candidatus Filomicrobium marinum TaxID=1608628 RepID=A0A0D6JGA1_9HYPH|nr:dihydrolipoyl dehydrogenase [Candidatus Filomicrobium marinum]CFX26695.1 Dihydrolipoamide dehydrogenase (E3) component ofpyruvate dehydrogenase [Candidatus Filomicrobium marinum]CPR19478.1 Dihydrolipoamide dehydrogenase (E3) component ofpyruvate dehydrogenase [Candidatus Filomicrobium marinum]